MKHLYKKALKYAEYCLRSLLDEKEQDKDLKLYIDIDSLSYNIHRYIIKSEYLKHILCYVTYDGLRMKWNFILYGENNCLECNEVDMLFVY